MDINKHENHFIAHKNQSPVLNKNIFLLKRFSVRRTAVDSVVVKSSAIHLPVSYDHVHCQPRGFML